MLPKKDVTIGEDVFVIRMLSWRSVEKAREARGFVQAAQLRAMGGDVLKGLRSEQLDEAAKSLQAKRQTLEFRTKERYDAHDRSSVLTAGVESSSRAGKIEDVINELKESEAQQLHEAVLDFSLPALDPAEAEEAPKEDIARYTGS